MGWPQQQSGWTDERVEKLKDLWSQGMAASVIAKQLGGVTRNAVIGKVHRLGLSPIDEATRAIHMKQRQARAETPRKSLGRKQPDDHPFKAAGKPIPPTKPASLRQAVVLEIRPAMLRDLPPKRCKWPLPDQEDRPGWMDEHLFCGAPAAPKPGKQGEVEPYCKGHMALAFRPSKPRKPKAHYEPVPASSKRSVFDRGLRGFR